MIGHSRQPSWDLGNLIEMLVALGSADGIQPVFELLNAGLLYPRLRTAGGGAVRIKTFENGWPSPARPAWLFSRCR